MNFKAIKVLLAGILAAASLLSRAASFGPEVAISDAASGANFPEVAFHNNVLHATWVQYPVSGAGGEIMYARSTDQGATWSTPLNLTNTPTAEDRPLITAGPSGVVVAWITDANTGAIFARRSGDGGASFAAATQLADSGGDTYSRLTHLTTDSGGRIHMLYYDNAYSVIRGVAGDVRHRMSCDGGVTWSADTAVTLPSVTGDTDNEEPRLAEVGGRIYITFRTTRYGNPQGGFVPYSLVMTRGNISGCGITLQQPYQRVAGGVPFTLASVFAAHIAADPNGNLHVLWWDRSAGTNVRYRKGNPAQAGFGATQALSNFGVDHLEPGGLASTPSAASGGLQVQPGFVTNGTRALVAYQRQTQVVGNNEFGPIYLRESSNNGDSFGAEQEIASAAATPRLVSMAGTDIGIIWGDSRAGTRIYFRRFTDQAPVDLTRDTDNDGIPDGIEVQEGRNPNAKDNDIFGNARLFVMQQYRDFLGREGDAGGVSFNASQITSGAQSRTQMTSSFFNSGEFQGSVAPITRLYLGTYRRVPDTDGLLFWIGEYRKQPNTAKLQEIATAFATAPEFVSAYGNLDNVAFVNRLYELILERPGDAGGVNFWVSELNRGVTRGVMLANFTESDEYKQKTGSDVFVISIYVGMLRRAPDQSGFDFWRNNIRAGASGDGLINAFLTSGEYRARFLP